MTEPDPDLVREFMVHERLRSADDGGSPTDPEIRYFREYYPRHLARLKREAEQREKETRMWAEAAEDRKRAEHQIWLMKDMREWGRENGYFVGTRGRIPRRVIEAYNEAKGHA
ncbi:Lsr2 family DNA-binding protein [Streptomyces graminilatus]|uniref:Lsr2 family DNA-binding protein n=1 Tax=Streptomyces graminilatus TaxID=1464070 RepID=UPI0006E4428C|nr:histone-like nucleoid-structuring protein Lsr2 [Streptomyces graminilatus]